MFKKILAVALVATLTLSQAAPAFAGPPHHGGGGWGPGPRPGPCGPRWGGWGPGGKALFWTDFGLTVGALALGAAVAYLPPERTVIYSSGVPYYYYGGSYFTAVPGGYMVVNPPVVVQQQPQTIVVQQPAPQQVVVQQPAPQQVVVQQPAPQQQVVMQQPVQQQPAVQAVSAPQQQNYNAPPAYPSALTPAPKSDSSTYDIYLPNGNGTFTLVQLSKTGNGYLGPQGEYYPEHPTMDQLKERYLKK